MTCRSIVFSQTLIITVGHMLHIKIPRSRPSSSEQIKKLFTNLFLLSLLKSSISHDQTCYDTAKQNNLHPISIAIFTSNNEKQIPRLKHTNTFYQWDRKMVEPAVEQALATVNSRINSTDFMFCKTGDGYYDDQCSQQVGPDLAVSHRLC